jgi:5S rRNA maturation endonuclease (ribonuclease M5)
MNTPSQTVLDALHVAGGAPREASGGWSFRCPCSDHSHGDRRPSGRLGVGADGRVLLWCGRGHPAEEIVAALGLDIKALFPNGVRGHGFRVIPGGRHRPASMPPLVIPRRGKPHLGDGGITAIYDCANAKGEVIYRVGRTADKSFPTAHVDAKNGWVWGHPPDAVKVLFGLPDVIAAVARRAMVVVVEGEKDALAMNTAEHGGVNYVATTKMGGARSRWLPQYTDALRDAHVIIVADKDPDGAACAQATLDGLLGAARRVYIVEAKVGKDASDHLDAGFGIRDFVQVFPVVAERVKA